MDLKTFRYFVAVYEYQSFSKAAAHLGITQPTLSRQMQELEKQIGHPLLVRSKKAITLTKEGMIFLKRAQEILQISDQLKHELSPATPLSGDLHLSLVESGQSAPLMQAIYRFQKKYPQVRMHLRKQTETDLMQACVLGLCDLGVIHGHSDDPLLSRSVLTKADTLGIIISKNHPLSDKVALTNINIKGQDLYIPEDLSDAYLQKHKLFATIRGTYLGLSEILPLVQDNTLILSYEHLLEENFYTPYTFKKLIPEMTLPLSLVYKKGSESLLLQTFMTYLKEDL
ncbi:MAG: LysR family transcriptional regulator [Intestinibaculum porci]|uniref:LysR family transcriptional regulator n=1 Tax=Intestinibaculum porci TaxID=2487118 RepID=UPI003EFDC4AE